GWASQWVAKTRRCPTRPTRMPEILLLFSCPAEGRFVGGSLVISARVGTKQYGSTIEGGIAMLVDRRQFLRGSGLAAWSLAAPSDLLAQQSGPSTTAEAWDAGAVRHVLPTVSDTKMLIKASFAEPLAEAPVLRVGDASVRGRMNDTRGEFWQFHATDLAPGRPYRLALTDANGQALSQPWELATFP